MRPEWLGRSFKLPKHLCSKFEPRTEHNVVNVLFPLQKCGKMNSWKRVQGTAGKLQAFGFCEYANPESTLRALRLLHGLSLGSKSLTVSAERSKREGRRVFWAGAVRLWAVWREVMCVCVI